MARLPLYATTTRGTEAFLAQEIERCGAKRIRQDRGGVRFMADLDEALRICLWSRIAMRILYPLGSFEVEGQQGLYDATAEVPWEEWLSPKTTFAVEATLKESEHTHSGFVALKIKDAIVDRLRDKCGTRPNVDTRNPDFQIVAHLAKNTLSLSLDLCGDPLSSRGYRVQPTAAPLKQTLAAAMLMACNYEGDEPLVDPMCGSGTIAIEAALIATRRAPNRERSFAIETWPAYAERVKSLLAELRREAEAQVRPLPFPIFARDRDEDALDAAKKNIKAAGLSKLITVEEADALKSPPPTGPAGLVISNPPYGDRIGTGGQKGMKSFYFALGNAMAEWTGWRVAMLAGNPGFESAFHRRPSKRLELFNGAIECELLQYAARLSADSRGATE